MVQKLIVLLLPALIFVLAARTVFALTSPSFPLCTAPQGTVKASYADGVHGIVGDSASYSGQDTVYSLSDTTAMQCFCPPTGSGIQTNWWKVSPDPEDLQVLKNDGWMYVANGANWGLDDASYLAKNTDYECHGAVQGISTQSSNTSNSGNQPAPVQAVLGAATSALAFTGGSDLFYVLLGLGLILLASGVVLKRQGK